MAAEPGNVLHYEPFHRKLKKPKREDIYNRIAAETNPCGNPFKTILLQSLRFCTCLRLCRYGRNNTKFLK